MQTKQAEQKIQIRNWDIIRLHWSTQILANLFFGLSLAIIVLAYAGFSLQALKKTVLLYISIYFCIFVPLFGIFPVLVFKKAKKAFEKVATLKKEEIIKTIEFLLNLPFKLSLVIFVLVLSGFSFGAFILWKGFVPEFIPILEIITITCLSIGFCVAIIHAFLNYVFLENYLRPKIDFLGMLYPQASKRIKIRKLSLFFKVFILVLLTALASQISLWALFSARIGMASIAELKNAFFHASIVAILTLAYVFVIAILFSRNLTYPLKKMMSWADNVIKGKTKETISLITNDEIFEATEYLKEMVDRLEESRSSLEVRVGARTKELKALTESLEEKVKQRTKELELKIEELERFQKVTIGRELKMVQLKKELREAKKK